MQLGRGQGRLFFGRPGIAGDRTSGIEDAKDDHTVRRYLESNRDAVFKSDNSHAGADIVPQRTALGKGSKPIAPCFDSADVTNCLCGTIPGSDVFVQIKQVFLRLFTEEDAIVLQADFFALSACRARTAANTSSAWIAWLLPAWSES